MIDVAFTRAGVRDAGVAVVIDVLRATSTVAQALAGGYRAVLCADSIELAETLRAPGRVLAGERRCVPPPGFDLGNSPQDVTAARGEELVLATTNGAPAVVAAARHAPVVLLGCLLNFDALLAALPAGDLQVVCSGTDGAVAVEDVYVAGRICARVSGPRTDAARVAEAVALAYSTALDALVAGAGGRALVAAGLEADIAFCAQESLLDVVPRVAHTDPGVGVALVADAVDAGGTVGRAVQSASDHRCPPRPVPSCSASSATPPPARPR